LAAETQLVMKAVSFAVAAAMPSHSTTSALTIQVQVAVNSAPLNTDKVKIFNVHDMKHVAEVYDAKKKTKMADARDLPGANSGGFSLRNNWATHNLGETGAEDRIHTVATVPTAPSQANKRTV
jgi:uncharacterized protein YpuA (DUF1002 family)